MEGQSSAGSGRNDCAAKTWITAAIKHRWINGSTVEIRSIDIGIALYLALDETSVKDLTLSGQAVVTVSGGASRVGCEAE